MTVGDDRHGDGGTVASLDGGDIERTLDMIERELATAEPRRCYALLLTRGRLFAALSDPARAGADYSRALTLAESADQQGEVLIARGELALQSGEIDAARDDLERALELVDEPQRRVAAKQVLGRLERDHGDLERAIVLLRDARDQVVATGADMDFVGEAMLDLAIGLRAAGRVREAIRLLEDIVDRADPPLRARVLIQLGTNYGFLGRTAEAMHAFARALTLLPESERAVVRYNRAVVYRELGELDRALDELARALTDNAGTDPRIEHDALLLSGVIAREQGDYQGGLEALGRAISVAPDDDAQGRARLEVGTTLAAIGLFGPAIDEFTAAVELCSDDDDRAIALRRRGMARRELGLLEAALDDLEQAVTLTADSLERARLDITRSSLLAALGNRRQALDLAAAALHNVHDRPALKQLLVQRGSLRSELGDLDGAVLDLEEAARLIDESHERHLLASVLLDLGAIYAAVDATGMARDAFARAAAIAITGSLAQRALLRLGDLLVSSDMAFEALEVYELAAAAAEDDRDARAAAFLARGHAELQLELYGQAAEDFVRVLTLNPSQHLLDRAHVGQRTVQHHLEHVRAARDELTRAIVAADRPEYRAQPLLQRGMLALAAGDQEAAIVDVTRATSMFGLRGEKALAWAHLALIHAQLGQCDEALDAVREAQTLDPDGDWKHIVQSNWRWRRCQGSGDEGRATTDEG